MSQITLPDGSHKTFENPVTISEIAASIGPGLAKSALAGEVDGRAVDLSFTVDKDAAIKIITPTDELGREVLRHSAAHLLAHAVKQLFPEAQVTIGPVIEAGFYYDFAFERPFTPEDLAQIEARMAALAADNIPVSRRELSRDEAIALFEQMGEFYKVEIIKAIPADEILSVYEQGDFVDLCRGPHVPSTGHLKAFKLTKLSGAYWRGDSNNTMLQRIYGTAWEDKKALKAYLHRIEEAEKRDHRKLAKKMNLFHQQPEAPGMVFWHPNGWQLICTMRDYIRSCYRAYEYQEINTPQLVDRSLWEQSGHAAKYSEEMFTSVFDDREYALKPMSCPCHVQVFKQGVKSYRDLPVRYAEFGICHRNEPSGTLHGLMRARAFVQDDGHIFCREDQIHEEVLTYIQQLHQVYRDFGFTQVMHKLSTRPERRVGSEAIWDKAEQALEAALVSSGVEWELMPGDGAFYGPKIDFYLKDCLGRVWQCGTIQADFSMPERLEAVYVAEDGSKQTPVMLHRAILGSCERFLGILLEEYAGNLPVWLAPVQVAVLSITDRAHDYSDKLAKKLKKMGFRVNLDLRNEKIGFKIREHTIARVPYLLVIGDREVEDETVAVRTQSGSKTATMPFDQFVQTLRTEIDTKAKRPDHIG